MAGPPPYQPPPDLRVLLSAIDASAEAHDASPNEANRHALREAALALSGSLETPQEAALRMSMQPHSLAALRIAIEGHWLEALASADNATMTADQLSEATGAEVTLIVRIMRVIISAGIVAETDIRTYSCNRLTRIFTERGWRDRCIFTMDSIGPSMIGLPRYIANSLFVEPQNDALGPYTFAHGRTIWDEMSRIPEKRVVFNNFMERRRESREGAAAWLRVFPVDERLAIKNTECDKAHYPMIKGRVSGPPTPSSEDWVVPTAAVEIVDPSASSDDEVHGTEVHYKRLEDAEPDIILEVPTSSHDQVNLKSILGDLAAKQAVSGVRPAQATGDLVTIVDMGGGTGYDLLAFRAQYPNVRSTLILQDLPDSIASLDQTPLSAASIQVQPHDIFCPQPVRGATIYYLCAILHDWPDAQCVKILSNIAAAMTVNYSSVIIVDLMLPERNAPWFAAMLDMALMAAMCGKERTRAEWEELMKKAGLRLRDVWELEKGAEAVFECVLANDDRR